MLKQIYTGNTVAFTAIPTIDGEPQTLDGTTTVGFILKKSKNDPDEKALISKTSTDGQFTLSSQDTDIAPDKYWYEFRWYASSAVYTMDMGTVLFVQTVYE